MQLLSKLAGLLYPHKCFLCGEVLSSDAWLCETCELPNTGDELCPRCAKTPEDCLCGRAELYFDRALAPLYYSEAVSYGIHRFKYDGRQYYADFLGSLMADKIRQSGGALPNIVTFVPMSSQKKRWRGFCQSELLARIVAKELSLPLLDGCIRHTDKGGVQMAQKGFEQRRKNAKISFQSGHKLLQDKHILLIDDVLTTGSTLARCSQLLKEQGALSVAVLCAATTKGAL